MLTALFIELKCSRCGSSLHGYQKWGGEPLMIDPCPVCGGPHQLTLWEKSSTPDKIEVICKGSSN